jgi:hypothetical protein
MLVLDMIEILPPLENINTIPREYSRLSHPVLMPKPDAHRMYAQDQVVIHTARM